MKEYEFCALQFALARLQEATRLDVVRHITPYDEKGFLAVQYERLRSPYKSHTLVNLVGPYRDYLLAERMRRLYPLTDQRSVIVANENHVLIYVARPRTKLSDLKSQEGQTWTWCSAFPSMIDPFKEHFRLLGATDLLEGYPQSCPQVIFLVRNLEEENPFDEDGKPNFAPISSKGWVRYDPISN